MVRSSTDGTQGQGGSRNTVGGASSGPAGRVPPAAPAESVRRKATGCFSTARLIEVGTSHGKFVPGVADIVSFTPYIEAESRSSARGGRDGLDRGRAASTPRSSGPSERTVPSLMRRRPAGGRSARGAGARPGGRGDRGRAAAHLRPRRGERAAARRLWTLGRLWPRSDLSPLRLRSETMDRAKRLSKSCQTSTRFAAQRGVLRRHARGSSWPRS